MHCPEASVFKINSKNILFSSISFGFNYNLKALEKVLLFLFIINMYLKDTLGCWWLLPAVLVAWEVKIKRITVPGQPGK
jgi:hypothetical protein